MYKIMTNVNWLSFSLSEDIVKFRYGYLDLFKIMKSSLGIPYKDIIDNMI